jgi:hypothetical protein
MARKEKWDMLEFQDCLVIRVLPAIPVWMDHRVPKENKDAKAHEVYRDLKAIK